MDGQQIDPLKPRLEFAARNIRKIPLPWTVNIIRSVRPQHGGGLGMSPLPNLINSPR
jgi:hypothetical protein